jgi:hypothetical protein
MLRLEAILVTSLVDWKPNRAQMKLAALDWEKTEPYVSQDGQKAILRAKAAALKAAPE